MVASFSPHRDAGGTLHLPSPSGIHHSHTNSALNQLRRSLSRSPSKGTDFRILSPSRLHSPSKHAQFVASPLSPSRRANSQGNLFLVSTASTASPVAVPYPPSARIHRPGMRRNGSASSSRTRTTPPSPVKRILTESRDHGNSSLAQVPAADFYEGKSITPLVSMQPPPFQDDPADLTITEPRDGNLGSKLPPSRIEKRRSGTFNTFPAASSPLKRSDGLINIDQTNGGSPSAKRRSVHNASFEPEFDVFGGTNSPFPDTPFTSRADKNSAASNMPSPSVLCSPVPKRSSSLRKSTLQQRQNERLFFPRKSSVEHTERPSMGVMVTHGRERMSLDNSIFSPANRDSTGPPSSLFASTSTRPNSTQAAGNSQQAPAAHPLSRSITQSSSSSSFSDGSPTTASVSAKVGGTGSVPNFSKSLPPGSTRPFAIYQQQETGGSDSTFATPENYKLVKPLPAAFMSTGLISKKNRNASDIHNASPSTNKNMPDTPCKRTSQVLPILRPSQKVGVADEVNGRSRDSPWTPFNSSMRSGKNSAVRGMGIFGSTFIKPSLSRRGSLASTDGDENFPSESPSTNQDSQSTMESDLPPTPTKQTSLQQNSQFSNTSYRFTETQNLFSPQPGGNVVRPHSSPHTRKSADRPSPQTPQDHILPPDPSGLSISAHYEPPPTLGPFSATLPATPTASRESFPQIGKRPSLALSGYTAPDVDPCLTSRFDKVELIGTGEFSQVYSVTERLVIPSFQAATPSSSKRPFSPSPPRRVWAIKRSKQPFTGVKDRERRSSEVTILKALTNSDHVISFADSWEHNNYLYIQTEFCEEGSLDVFLSQAGLKARLDDFRIWKILLELSLGLKSIHDAGFIHLDLKPANILITFEGVLKIADFGMATHWPAPEGIEGEGDREYIGPEILMGRYDKPADIFALGLVMFEIAGNVELPDNGVSWQKLRNGDMSDVPSLTWSSETSNILRDSSGNPLPNNCSFESLCSFDDTPGIQVRPDTSDFPRPGHNSSMASRSGELAEPPSFMVDPNNDQALDKIVRWMISPDPADRPVADDVIQAYGVRWAEQRRRAGATIYEGNWGPADEVLSEDAEMIDV